MQTLQKVILARALPRREMWAAENIVRQGHQCYFPKVYVHKRLGKFRNEVRVEPLFPTYIFVFAEQWRWLLGTFGVQSVIMRGQFPDFIPMREIDKLRSLEDGISTGVVQLPGPEFKKDDQVEFKAGAMKHCRGVVEGMDAKERIRVLVDFLGGKVKMLVEPTELELV